MRLDWGRVREGICRGAASELPRTVARFGRAGRRRGGGGARLGLARAQGQRGIRERTGRRMG